MRHANPYLYVWLSVGGALVCAYLARQVYRWLRTGEVPRRYPFPPLTRQAVPLIYWAIIACVGLSTMALAAAAALALSKLLKAW